MKKGVAHILLLFLILIIPLAVAAAYYYAQNKDSKEVEASPWAFEETFEGCVPSTTTSCPLPTNRFDFISTHRARGYMDTETLEEGYGADHSVLPNGQFSAEHSSTCGPPPATHIVQADQNNDTQNPEKTFFMCGGVGNGHMMSSAAHISGYSVTNFWPRQEFDFSDGNGVVEFDTSLAQFEGGRVWYEILIAPKEEMQVAAAKDTFPIDETYPKNRLIFATHPGGERHLKAGKGAIEPGGSLGEITEGRWSVEHLGDPALTDSRIRRKNILEINGNTVSWKVQQADGGFDNLQINLSAPLGFSKGLVMFKTHSYTPTKANNWDKNTFHWDNIRFDGPALTPYESTFARPGLPEVVRGVGQTVSQTVNLTRIGANPAIAGQFGFPTDNAIALSINGNPSFKVNLHTPTQTENGCGHRNFGTFRNTIDPAHLKIGSNTLVWTVVSGGCDWNSSLNNILGLKAVHIQMDSEGGTGGPAPTSAPSPAPTSQPVLASPTPSPSPSPTPTPSPTPSPTPKPTPIPSPSPSPSPSPTPVPQAANTFVGQYFNTTSFTRLKATRVDAKINFDWGIGRPHSAVHEETFSVRWLGDFNFLAGTYKFNVTTDDGMRIWIDDALVFDKWFGQAPTNYNFTRNMTFGVHNVKVEYYDNKGRAVAKVDWVKQ